MGHKDDPRKNRANQLVSLLALDIAILGRERKRVVESHDCKFEINTVLGAIGFVLRRIEFEIHKR